MPCTWVWGVAAFIFFLPPPRGPYPGHMPFNVACCPMAISLGPPEPDWMIWCCAAPSSPSICEDHRSLAVAMVSAASHMIPRPIETCTVLRHHAGPLVTASELVAPPPPAGAPPNTLWAISPADRAVGCNDVGIVAWTLTLRSPECPAGRQVRCRCACIPGLPTPHPGVSAHASPSPV